MELERFKETLLEFLSDVTSVSKKGEVDYAVKGNKAPNGYSVLTPYLLIKIETSSKVPERPTITREEGQEPTVVEQGKEEIYHCIVKFKFYTEDHVYHISSTWLNNHAQYLGCIANRRLQRPGEDHVRGQDLPDGYFCRETWEAIKNAILRNEMKAISKYIVNGHYENPQVDEDIGPQVD